VSREIEPGQGREVQPFCRPAVAAVPEAIEARGVLTTCGPNTGLQDQSLSRRRRDALSDGGLLERDPSKVAAVPPCKGPFVLGTVATHMAKGGVSREHEHQPQQMGDNLVRRLLGWLETTQHTLEQSHGVPPLSVA
jgi:hypothetical protein